MKGRVTDCDGLGVGHLRESAAGSTGPRKAREEKPRMGRGGLEKRFGAYYNYSFNHAGAHRKPAGQMGRTPLCVTRVWIFVVSLASLLLLASITPFANSIEARIFCPRKLNLLHSRDPGSAAKLLWERRTEEMFTFSFTSLRRKSAGSAASKTYPRALTAYSRISEVAENYSEPATPYIEDVVIFPEDLDLFIVRHGSSVNRERVSACSYGAEPELKAVPRTVNLFPDRRMGVTCMRPPSLRMQKTFQVANVSLELDAGAAAPLRTQRDGILKPAVWDRALVYAVQATDVDVILYVKNLLNSSSRAKAKEYTELENFRCRFGDAMETPVTTAADEVFRCESPSVNHPTSIVTRVKVHLLYKGNTIPSVAYYEPFQEVGSSTLKAAGQLNTLSSGVRAATTPKKYAVCSCTMVWNVAKFLKEWVLFNSDIGVEKFFLYDNNSEDEIRSVVSELSEYNVTRINWPWVKTQEAGFSNCAMEAQRSCNWILFTDVDEFLFPKRWLKITEGPETEATASFPKSGNPLKSLIHHTLKRVNLHAVGKGSADATAASMKPGTTLQVGQISFRCRNFGPSGRTSSPSDGVTQGYTCRDQGELRHKSLVYFPALKSSLQNVIHHFHLKAAYHTVFLDVRQAVVNHYKYQAWDEFEKKFAKRASTHVADWKETKNLNSKDRPEGVGPEATKPPDWETSHCVLNDTSLRDYTRRRYGVIGSGDPMKMAWEL